MSVRRLIRPLTILVGLVLVATGCAPGTVGDGGDEGSDGQVALRMSTWGNDSRLKLTEEAAAAFEQANPGITVQVENSEWTGYWDKLATQTAGDDPPDVIQMDESYIAAYGGRDALLDLGTQSSVLDLSAMDAKVLDTGKVGGTLVGAPVGVALFSVGVNPDLLKQAGLKMPDDKTWTWDDLATMAATVTEKLGSEGVAGMDFFGVNAAEIGAWTRQHDQEVFPMEGQTAVTAETLQSYFEFAKQMLDTKATPPAGSQVEDTDQRRWTPPGSPRTRRRSTCSSTPRSPRSSPPAGATCSCCGCPRRRRGNRRGWSTRRRCTGRFRPRGEHPAEAAKLVDFLMTDPAAVKILKVERGVPAIAAVQSEIEPVLDATGRCPWRSPGSCRPRWLPPPQVTPQNASGYSGEVTRIGTDVLFERKTPADAAKELLAVIEESSR